MGDLLGAAMGYGGILWIWMTMIISIVHLSPVMFDFDHLSEKSPESFEKIKLGSETFIVPGVRTNIGDRFVQNWSSQYLDPFSRPRRAGKCLFNSLAYNCDFQDAIGAAQEASYWGSGSPGRRKRVSDDQNNPYLHCHHISYNFPKKRSDGNNYWMRVGRKK